MHDLAHIAHTCLLFLMTSTTLLVKGNVCVITDSASFAFLSRSHVCILFQFYLFRRYCMYRSKRTSDPTTEASLSDKTQDFMVHNTFPRRSLLKATVVGLGIAGLIGTG